MEVNENNSQEIDDKNISEGWSEQLPYEDTDTSQKEIKIELPNMEELSKSINRLSSRLGIAEIPEKDERMYIGGKKEEKYITDNENHKLDDVEIFRRSLKQIKNYEKNTHKKAPIPPKFVAFMEDYVKVVGGGAMTGEEYKKNNIYREMPLDQITNLE